MTEKERKKEERIQIPRVTYEGKDEVLKEQVVHYEKGTRRIVLFTVVGLLLGWFSYCYYGEEFLPLKIILAIPYKCSELLHQSLHGDHGLYLRSWIFAGDAFFPQAPNVSYLAEYGTSALFGGAVYGSLAYFTGDKRIFTLTGYLRFGFVWAAVIGVWTGALFGANAWQVSRNNQLKEVSGMFVNGEEMGRGYYAGYWEKNGDGLRQAFYEGDGPRLLKEEIREPEGEVELDLYFGAGGKGAMYGRIHPKKGYLVTDQGLVYQMTDAFMELYRACEGGYGI